MTEQDERQAKAMAVLELAETKQHLGVLHAEADRIGSELSRLGTVLRVNPETISFDGEGMGMNYALKREDFRTGLLNQENIQRLARDIRETIERRDRLQDRVRQMGLDR
jgi:hypothetical protein